MAFTPGSPHTVTVRVRNAGTWPAGILPGGANIELSPIIGLLPLSFPSPIPAGGEASASADFIIPGTATPGTLVTWWLTIAYDGRALATGGDAFTVEAAGPQVFYAIDTWEEYSGGAKARYGDVACGWLAGPSRVAAHLLFGTIPTNISRATLKFFLLTGFGPQPFGTEMRDPFYGLLGMENNSPPATITLDVTAVVKARGMLWVVINPAFWQGVQQFKYFGGIWNEDRANTYWPRIEVS